MTDSFEKQVQDELTRARTLFPNLHSAHEGYAVIIEEVDELWEEVRKKNSKRDYMQMYKELIQIAAMSRRMVEDVVEKEMKR